MVICFTSHFSKHFSKSGKQWVLVGKGPSFGEALAHSEDDRFLFFCLNDASAIMGDKATYSHFTDLDAFHRCKASIHPSSVVIMPWRPHVNNSVGRYTLVDLSKSDLSIFTLAAAGRLVSYHSTLDRGTNTAYLKSVRVRKFSAVAGVNLLAAAGVRTILTAGIDGGCSYHSCFDKSSLLSNGRKSFDSQKKEIKLASKTYGLNITSLSNYVRQEADHGHSQDLCGDGRKN